MPPLTRKRLFSLFRLVVCVAALWFVARGVTLHDHVIIKEGHTNLVGQVTESDDRIILQLAHGDPRVIPRQDLAVDDQGEPHIVYGLKTVWGNSVKMLLLLAVLIHFPVTLLQALRLQWLLGAQNIRIGYRKCMRFSFAGNFLNFATPLGSNAGDVFKAYFVTTHTDQKTEAATTIALDRIIGLGTLMLCVAAITTFETQDSRLREVRPYVLSLLVVGIIVVSVYLWPPLRKHLVPKRWLSRLPMFEHLQRIDHTVRQLAGHKTIVVRAVLITLLLQVTAISAYFLVAIALALQAHAGNALEYYAYFSSGAMIAALPGPPQGLGTVELAYRYFLAPYGSPSQIICVAFMIRLIVLTCSLPGLVVMLTGSYKPRRATTIDNRSTPLQPPRCNPKHDPATP